ncbi:hypothetical protein CW745_14035 [Psychromonas sp. psych-6C06]|uniref:hypothetical protein n=1 Tax=Psychromonas sp. psych-6C06 TaxID=2058089 RepID=UPI000C33FB0E|nr:hypothetical protein [Psychromonas sp. psych-6C06]PKF60646.1 hypothetical protein CW745_14035 [Psychromonas sp. psych-6C06]
MKLNFDILTTLLFACENQTGKTIDDMKNAVDWNVCTKQVQAVIDYMVNQKFLIAIPHKVKGGKKQPTRWVTTRHLRNATLSRASNHFNK